MLSVALHQQDFFPRWTGAGVSGGILTETMVYTDSEWFSLYLNDRIWQYPPGLVFHFQCRDLSRSDLKMWTFIHRGKKEIYAVSCSWLSSLTARFYTCLCCRLIRPCSPLWVAMSRHDTARVTLNFLAWCALYLFDVWGTTPWWVFAEQLWFHIPTLRTNTNSSQWI